MTQRKTHDRSKNLVDTLLSEKNDKFEVWKYFEDRASELGERLWQTGIWLIGILAAIISLPFLADYVSYNSSNFPLKIDRPIPVVIICILGIVFCIYSYFALLDIREHIEGNWRRSTYALTGKWEEPTWGGRKRSGWNTLLVIGISSLLGFM